MSLFILPENQKLIWNTMNKVPLFIKLGNDVNNEREHWFKEIIHDTYERNKTKPLSVQELRQLNKETISYMINKLKSSNQDLSLNSNDSVSSSFLSTTSITDSSQGFTLNDDKTATRNYMLEQKQDVLNNEFTNRQQDFDSMMKREPVKDIDFREKNDAGLPIENMDELLQIQMREREYDVELSSSTTMIDSTKDDKKNLPKNVKWAAEIESGPSNQFVELDIFHEFVRKTNIELHQLRAEISTLRAEKLMNISNEHHSPGNTGTSAVKNILSRLRKTAPTTITSIGDLEDVSHSLAI